MKCKLMIYRCLFEEEKYIRLDMRPKYILALIYAFTDSNNYSQLKQRDISNMMNITKQNVNDSIRLLERDGFIKRITANGNRGTIKINKPNNKGSIPISRELIDGKYQALSKGTKLFYSYYRWVQEQEESDYIKIKGVDIVKRMNESIKSIQAHCKELEEVGLLQKSKQGNFNTFDFK